MPRQCARWCNRWTTTQPPCAECTACTAAGCYFPRALPSGIDGNEAAGLAVAYGNVDATSPGVVELRGNSRAYLVRQHDDGQSEYQHLNLLGKTLRFTADVSKVPCSCNAALYFVEMSGHSPTYCDIQTQPSCTEVSLAHHAPDPFR